MASCIVPLVVPGGKIAALASAGLGALMSLASEADSNPPTTSSTSRDEMVNLYFFCYLFPKLSAELKEHSF